MLSWTNGRIHRSWFQCWDSFKWPCFRNELIFLNSMTQRCPRLPPIDSALSETAAYWISTVRDGLKLDSSLSRDGLKLDSALSETASNSTQRCPGTALNLTQRCPRLPHIDSALSWVSRDGLNLDSALSGTALNLTQRKSQINIWANS